MEPRHHAWQFNAAGYCVLFYAGIVSLIGRVTIGQAIVAVVLAGRDDGDGGIITLLAGDQKPDKG